MTAPDVPLDPAALRHHYQAFLRPDRVLLTGHSHQAWPDVARAAMLRAFDDAALHVDDKWGAAFEVADEPCARPRHRRSVPPPRDYALDASTHALVDALSLSPAVVEPGGTSSPPRASFTRCTVSSGGSPRRASASTLVDPSPVDTLAERLAAAVTADTAAVLCSSVLFETSSGGAQPRDLAARGRAKLGAQLLSTPTTTSAFVPFDRADYRRRRVPAGGGYKYAQWGEGVCFLGRPRDCACAPW
jgi:kynureninase